MGGWWCSRKSIKTRHFLAENEIVHAVSEEDENEEDDEMTAGTSVTPSKVERF